MRALIFVIMSIALLVFVRSADSQSSAAFQSLTYPLSVTSQGLGEQGVASRDPIDAMEYNPANLVYENGVSISMYRNPWEILSRSFGGSSPIESFVATAKIGTAGNLGLGYTDQDFGEVLYATESSPGAGEKFHFYEQSFAAGYAISASDEFAAGIQLRYARQPFPQNTIDHLLISTGIGYNPGLLDNRMNVAFSLTNLGTRINYGSYTDTVNSQPVTHLQTDSPPADLNIGIEVLPVTNNFYDIIAMASAKKPITKRGGSPDYVAESSFEALFNDWSDFPDDVTGQIGIGYIWRPIYLGGGVSYFQQFYVGYSSTGPKDIYNSFYTHGINVGIDAYGIKATVGYAGRWHNNNAGAYATWDFPWETFQFTLSTDGRFFERDDKKIEPQSPCSQIVVSGGYGYGVFLGRMRGESLPTNQLTLSGLLPGNVRVESLFNTSGNSPAPSNPSSSYSLSPRASFSVCSDFYFDKDLALTTSFAYTRIKGMATIYTGIFGTLSADLSMETFTVTSGLRVHPVSFFHPFFVQGDLGIVRRNPIAPSSPAYDYKSLTDMAVGAVLPLLDTRIVLIPTVTFRTLFAESSADGSRLGGYNQFLFELNVGYEF